MTDPKDERSQAACGGVLRLRAGSAMVLAAIMAGQIPGPALGFSERTWANLQKSGTEALDSNRYWLAEPLLKRSVAEAEKYGFDNWRLAKSLGELGRLYTIRGRFADAEPYLERELAVRELVHQSDEGKLVQAMGSLVLFYLNYGTASKADPLAEDVLAIVEGKMRLARESAQSKTALKPGAPLEGWCGAAAPKMLTPLMEWAVTCDAMGSAYLARERFDLAEKLFKAALDVKLTILGSKHLSLARSYDFLGNLCLAKKDHKEAESYFRDSLDITEKILPPESPEIYTRLDKLAKLLIETGRLDEAEAQYRRALAFWKQEPSKGGAEARALYQIGSLYIQQKRYADAASILRQALSSAEKAYGPCQITLVPYLQRYAYALYYLGRRGEMSNLRARADSIAGTPG